eukprot:IDg2991t1
MTGDQLKKAFSEMFPPADLFAPDILAFPAVYSSLRDWLNKNGANIPLHSTRRILLQLAQGLYDDNEETVAAVDIVKSVISRGRSSGAAAPATSTLITTDSSRQGTGDGENASKVAHNIAMRFRENSAKFSGDIGESWIEYVAEYLQVSRDYNLSTVQKLQFLHNILRGDAKRFYLDQIQGHVNSFQQAVDSIGREYNSIVRQNRVKNYLSGIRL